MALVTLAVIGKDNEPLYLRDFVQSRSEGEEIEKEGTGDALSKRAEDETKIETDTPPDGSSSSSVGNTFDVDDPFGFLTQELEPNESSSLKHQFMIHAALDRFEEITLAGDGRGWRTPGSIGANAMWIGLLCPIEELCIYGYLTNTGIKFLAVIEDTNDKQQQQSRESDLKHLFELLHDYYVEHTLNPFSKIRAKISSRRFDAGVSKSVGLFNRNYVSKEFWM
mmetsp:Transcript_31292/g.45610  ORF Transcript_31292/g.45610 Transcript_31292/m.45610 type:complete len:223 (+) Transcript_31292:114-782(+)